MARARRVAAPAMILAATLYALARPWDTVPALGPLLEPASGVWALARTRAPNESTVPGLRANVRVVYDRRAVPHIFAGTEEDAYRALGYVVARDRLFQLYIQNMVASGRLSEIAGRGARPLDAEMRRMGLTRAAERWAAMADTASPGWRAFRAYADGVNAYIGSMRAAEIPLEFRLLGVRPEPWQPVSSLHVLARMGWTLAAVAPELARERAAAKVGRAAAAALFPANTPLQEPIQPNGRHAPRFDVARLPPPGAPDTGAIEIAASVPPNESWMASNNWAVSPARSATGHALLEGDPHLELTLPSVWYEAHLVVPGALDVYGVTIPGLPAIVIGFNRDVAWSFTNTGADVMDFYTETVDDDARPTRYRLDGTWKPLERRVESYRDHSGNVFGADTVYYTHRGPMRKHAGRWTSMRWTVLEPWDSRAFVDAVHARAATELEANMAAHFWAPAQNIVAADRTGTIAIQSTGHFPVRPGDGSGMVVRDGSASASDWLGYLPPNSYPRAVNPAQGYLASANQQPVDPRQELAYFAGSYDPWRAMRINQLLRADSTVTVDEMRQFETDAGSPRADLFVPYFLRAAGMGRGAPSQTVPSQGSAPAIYHGVDTAKAALAGRLLSQWDRRYTRENTRAVLFEAAMAELVRRTWDELETGGRRVATPSLAVLAELLADSTSVWWDDRRTAEVVETRDDILRASLAAAYDSVRRQHGDPGGQALGWTWGQIQHQNIYHLMHLPSLSALGLSVQGGPETLSPVSGQGTQGASWRMVVELGPEVRAWGTYPGGQSGNPARAHYRDHVATWVAGQLEPLAFPRAAAELGAGQTLGTLTLRPSRP